LNPIPLPDTESGIFGHVLAVGEQCGDKNFKNRHLGGCETIYAFVNDLDLIATQEYVPIKYTMWLYTGPDGNPSVGSASDVFTPANAGVPPVRPNVAMPGYMIKLDWCATAEWLRTVPPLWLTTSDGVTTNTVKVKMLLTPTNHTV
jgi:hypothetical protein